MQKYNPISDETPAMREDSENGSWYWCQDVDDRIEQLERALRSCQTMLVRLQLSRESYAAPTQDAIDEANRALMESGR